MNLPDCNVLITGGSGGIGRGLVNDLCKEAKNIIILDKSEPEDKAGDNVHFFPLDLTSILEIEETVKKVYNSIGEINVLVNNAGVIHSEPLINLFNKGDKKHSFQNWSETIEINLNAVFFLSAYISEKMVEKRTKGLIINMSSISSYGNAGQSAYAASKAGINALTKTWAKELGMFGIRCNAIAPGFIDTPSTADALNEAKIKQYKKMTPLGRLGKVDEISKAVRFIIDNDFYTGDIMDLNGGLSI